VIEFWEGVEMTDHKVLSSQDQINLMWEVANETGVYDAHQCYSMMVADVEEKYGEVTLETISGFDWTELEADMEF
jgi:hypothetical protein